MPRQYRHPRVRGIPRLKQIQCTVGPPPLPGGMEPDTPYLRQRDPGGVRLQAIWRGATAPPASTTQVSPLMGSAAPPPSAARFTVLLFAAERGAGRAYVDDADLGATLTGGGGACAGTTAGYSTLRRGSRSTAGTDPFGCPERTGLFDQHAGRHLRPCDRKRTGSTASGDSVCGRTASAAAQHGKRLNGYL